MSHEQNNGSVDVLVESVGQIVPLHLYRSRYCYTSCSWRRSLLQIVNVRVCSSPQRFEEKLQVHYRVKCPGNEVIQHVTNRGHQKPTEIYQAEWIPNCISSILLIFLEKFTAKNDKPVWNLLTDSLLQALKVTFNIQVMLFIFTVIHCNFSDWMVSAKLSRRSLDGECYSCICLVPFSTVGL